MGSIAVVTFLHLVLSCSHAVFEAYVCLFLFGRDGSTAMTRSSHQNVVKKKSTLLLPSLQFEVWNNTTLPFPLCILTQSSVRYYFLIPFLQFLFGSKSIPTCEYMFVCVCSRPAHVSLLVQQFVILQEAIYPVLYAHVCVAPFMESMKMCTFSKILKKKESSNGLHSYVFKLYRNFLYLYEPNCIQIKLVTL